MSFVKTIHEWYKSKFEKKETVEILSVGTVQKFDWLKKVVVLNGVNVEFILDSGAQISCITEDTWKLVGSPTLSEVEFSGKSYTGHEFTILGNFECTVRLNEVEEKMAVYVTKAKMNLFGLPWIVAFENKLGFPIVTSLNKAEPTDIVGKENEVFMVHDSKKSIEEELKAKFSQVFGPELGKCSKIKAHLHLKKGVKPVFIRARPVPLGVKKSVEEEIDRLLNIGAIKPIEFADWAAPILAVRKQNGKIRVCID